MKGIIHEGCKTDAREEVENRRRPIDWKVILCDRISHKVSRIAKFRFQSMFTVSPKRSTDEPIDR